MRIRRGAPGAAGGPESITKAARELRTVPKRQGVSRMTGVLNRFFHTRRGLLGALAWPDRRDRAGRRRLRRHARHRRHPLPVGSKTIPRSLPVVHSDRACPPRSRRSRPPPRRISSTATCSPRNVVYATPRGWRRPSTASREIRAIKVFGPAPYLLTVKAESGGAYQTISGLENLDLPPS